MISIGIWLFALVLSIRASSSLLVAISFGALSALYMLFGGAYLIADYLSGDGINDAVLYHLDTSLFDAGFQDFWKTIVAGLVYISASLVFSLFVIKWFRAKADSEGSLRRSFVAFTLVFGAFAVHPATVDIAEVYQWSVEGEAPQQQLPRDFVTGFGFGSDDAKKNLIYIYVESLERTYLDENLFPGLLPNLTVLEKQAVTFTDVNQVDGTSWTIAGMTASQCGVPLLVGRGLKNSMAYTDQFLPGARCVGDVLSDAGYTLTYMGGASLKFAGKGTFYRTHGFDEVLGLDELRSELIDPEYLSNWGLYDDSLFRAALPKLIQLHGQESPFALFLLTLDTHHPTGNVSSACKDEPYGDGSNPILNAVHCTDRLVADFVRHIMASDLYKNTMIVIGSDHYAMKNTAMHLLKQGQRRNLFMAFSEDLSPRTVNTVGSSLDLYPTLLDLLGAGVKSASLGRSLLSANSSLFRNVRQFNQYLSDNRDALQLLWSFPQVRNGFMLLDSHLLFEHGERRVKWPLVLLLDESFQVSEVFFKPSNLSSLSEKVTALPKLQRYLWVDKCTRMPKGTVSEFGENTNARSELCVLIGVSGATTMQRYALHEGQVVDYARIQKMISHVYEEAMKEETPMASVDSEGNPALSIERDFSAAGLPVERVSIRSVGGLQPGKSEVNYQLVADSALRLGRGINVIGLGAENPEVLHSVDLCARSDAVLTDEAVEIDVALADSASDFDVLAVVVHDSARCGGSRRLVSRLLPTLESLGIRTPYVATYIANEGWSEFVGPQGSTLTLELAKKAASDG